VDPVLFPAVKLYIINIVLIFCSLQLDRQEKIDICNTAMVVAIANKFVVGDSMPKIQYRTMVEFFADFCFLLQIIIYFSSAFAVSKVYLVLYFIIIMYNNFAIALFMSSMI